MTQETIRPILTAVFVDYDNIYLSLKKRSDDAAKRFSKDAASWIKDIENGGLITATNSSPIERPRRLALCRCYGNPVPRRNTHDNSTDMTSFPFVRHHFLKAGFEIVDCPPLTAQLKNSSDIRMVMDVRDFLNHETRFEEFIILSGDADFTPVLHRLRAHDRRTVIFANDFTAAPYRAISDGEIKEATLLSAILTGRIGAEADKPAIEQEAPAQQAIPSQKAITNQKAIPSQPSIESIRADIMAAVSGAVRSAGGPVPIEALAERTTRALGHDRTVGTGWAGAGSFLELLRRHLPSDIQLTDQPPFLAFEASRALTFQKPIPAQPVGERIGERSPVANRIEPSLSAPMQRTLPPEVPFSAPGLQGAGMGGSPAGPLPPRMSERIEPALQSQAPAPQPRPISQPKRPALPIVQPAASAPAAAPPPPSPQQQQQQRQAEATAAIQQSIARIHDACQAPPLSPPEYRALFEAMAKELNEAGLQGSQTLSNICSRAQEVGIQIGRDDVRFIMEVVSEADPWFEQGASANLFAGRFRNFVVARCRSQGLSLSSDELDLIEAWFAGTGQPLPPQNVRVPAGSAEMPAQQGRPKQATGTWNDQQSIYPQGGEQQSADEEFPKILRTRLRG
jgi:hypothetical protein